MDDRHLSNIPKLKKKHWKEGKSNKMTKSIFCWACIWTDGEEEGSEEKNGKEGKLDRNEHVLVVFYCLFYFSSKHVLLQSVWTSAAFCGFLEIHILKRAFQSQWQVSELVS
jgi:hypothetical protein